MKTVMLTCAHCGDIELLPEDIIITLSDDSVESTYRFEHCGQIHYKSANKRTVSVLLAAGVYTEFTDDPITQREIKRFMFDLDRIPSEMWMRELTR